MARKFLFSVFVLFAFHVGRSASLLQADLVLEKFDRYDEVILESKPYGATVKDGILTLEGTEVRLTSPEKFLYGVLETRVRIPVFKPNQYYYFGFFNRDKWSDSTCWVVTNAGNRFILELAPKDGKWNHVCSMENLEAGKWYTVKLVWSSKRTELFVDGKSCGYTENPNLIPQVAMPFIFDVYTSDGTKGCLEISRLKITGTDVSEFPSAEKKSVPDFPTEPKKIVSFPPDVVTPAISVVNISPDISVTENKIKLENSFMRIQLSTNPGVTLKELYNKQIGAACLVPGKESRVFAVLVRGKLVDSTNFSLEKVSTTSKKGIKTVTLYLVCDEFPLEAELSLSIDKSAETFCSLKVFNRGSDPEEIRVVFPLLENLLVGAKPEDNYYFYPFSGGWASNAPYDLRATYGSAGISMQVLSLFNPRAGGGLYVWLKDSSGAMKTVMLRKVDKTGDSPVLYDSQYQRVKVEGLFKLLNLGTSMAFSPLPKTVPSGGSYQLPGTVIGTHTGDWRPGLESYSKWAHADWFTHRPIPDWLKGCFNFISIHDEPSIEHQRYLTREKIQPGDHLFQWAYWWEDGRTDRMTPVYKEKGWYYKFTFGDYLYEPEFGGLPALKEEIKRVQNSGGRVVFFTQSRLIWKDSKIGKEHGRDWAWMPEPGIYNEGWSHPELGTAQWNICPQAEGWQDYYAKTVARIIRDTGADGIYLDTVGWCPPQCFNPLHSHSTEPTDGMVSLLKKCAHAIKSVNSEAIVQIEDVGSDYLLQYTDSVWLKQFDPGIKFSQDFDLYSIDFLRFYFPEVKYAEWGPGADENGWKRTFFNGVGISCNPNEYLSRTGQVLRENADAFASLNPVPLVKTEKKYVYANKFPTKGKTIYTIYNKNTVAVNGKIIEVDHLDDYHYVELFYDEEISPEIHSRKASLPVKVKAQDVVCVAQLSELLSFDSERLEVRFRKPLDTKNLTLKVFEENDGAPPSREVKVDNVRQKIDLSDFRGKGKIILKLFNGATLADEKIVRI